MSDGESLRIWRIKQKPNLTRSRVAELLSQETGVKISASVIRDVEEGRSTKWLEAYYYWAVTHWSSQSIPNPPEKNLLINDADIWKDCDIFFNLEVYSPATEILLDSAAERWRCPVVLPSGTNGLRAIQLSDNKLFPVFPRRTILLFKEVLVPPLNTIVIMKSKISYHMGLLIEDKNQNAILTFDEEKLKTQNSIHSVLAGIFRNLADMPSPLERNITWNEGEPLRFSLSQFQALTKQIRANSQ